MGFSNAKQLWEAFLSGGMGFLLGLYYDVFRIWRKLTRPSSVVVFFQDCLFFATAAVAVFFFSLTMTDGTVRSYVLLGTAIGFFAYRHTVGNGILWLFDRLLCILRRIQARLIHAFSLPLAFLLRRLLVLRGLCRKIAKKSKEISKKVLQLVRRLLYNLTV